MSMNMSFIMRLYALYEQVPELDGMLIFLVFVLAPLGVLAMFMLYHHNCSKLRMRVEERVLPEVSTLSWLCYLVAYVLHKHAGLWSLLIFLWCLIATVFQSVFVVNHMQLGTDVTYYMQVNLPEYESVSNMDAASNLNSLNVVLLEYGYSLYSGYSGYSRKGSETLPFSYLSEDSAFVTHNQTESGNRKKLKAGRNHTKSSEEDDEIAQRWKHKVAHRIRQWQRNTTQTTFSLEGTSGSTDTLSIIYHTSDWNNVLTSQNLVDICKTEQAMIQQVDCVNIIGYKSMIPSIFNINNCEYFTSFEDSLYRFGLSENSAYVEDGVSAAYPKSDILISFFEEGTCKDYSESSLVSQFDAVEVNDITITYVSENFVQKEFIDAIFDAAHYSIVSVIFCMAFMVIGFRGVVLTLTTLFCIIISVLQAASMLVYWDYGSFSAFNVMSLFILIGVGANAVLMFASSWRRAIPKPGEHAATVVDVMKAYGGISQSVLFTTCAAYISLFSKLASPVIVISQLGAFMGVAVAVFYVLLHYLIIPMWIYTARFRFPLCCHQAAESVLHTCYLGMCICWFGEEKGRGYLAVRDSEDDHRPSAPTIHVMQTHPTVPSESSAPPFTSDNMLHDESEVQEATPPTTAARRAPSGPTISQRMVTCWKRIRGRHPLLTCSGIVTVLVTLFGLLLVAFFIQRNLAVDFGIPQLFSPESNIGQAMYVVKNYKSDVFTMHISGIDGSPTAAPVPAVPSFSPTRRPTGPTYSPSRAPTAVPSISRTPTTTFVSFYPTTISGAPTVSNAPSAQPVTASPTFRFRTVAPTVYPTEPTVTPSVAPTPSPSTATPTLFTTSTPTIYTAKYADYVVTGCWGIFADKPHIDSEADLTFNAGLFRKYAHADVNGFQLVNSGLLSDMKDICDYIDTHRDDLDVDPVWNKDRDCIYSQVVAASQSSYWLKPNAPPYNMNNVLIFWAAQEYISGTLLGVEYHNKTSMDALWACFNVSARTQGVDSLMSDTPLAIKLSNRWNDAFASHGSTYANKYGIPTVVGSSEFTFPMLASEVLFSIELAAVVSALGFIVLLCLFTSADVGLTLLGTLAMFVIIVVAICIHEYFFVGDFDLLDIVVLIAIMGMAVDFPIHYLMEFVTERQRYEKRQREEEELVDESDDDEEEEEEEEDEVEDEPEPDMRAILNASNGDESVHSSSHAGSGSAGINPEYVSTNDAIDNNNNIHQHLLHNHDQQRQIRPKKKKKFYPPLKTTMKYMTASLIAPLILTFLSGFPLLFAEFQLIRKCGQYIIILAVVSYVYCIFFLAYLMPLGCRATSCDKMCAAIEPEAYRVLEVDPDRDEDAPGSSLREHLLPRDSVIAQHRSERWSQSSQPIVMTTADFNVVFVPTSDVFRVDPVVDVTPTTDTGVIQEEEEESKNYEVDANQLSAPILPPPQSPIAHCVSHN